METGLISTLQRYSTKDGPGIRTTAFLVGCNLRCAWCANPELMLPGEKYLYYQQRCIKCGACVKAAGGGVTLTQDGCVIDRSAPLDFAKLAHICPQSAYEKKGIRMTSGELTEKLLRDREFYAVSGGGVTFSGGEAALQAPFVKETAMALKEEGIHTALDTAGLIPSDRFMDLAGETDLVLYDIKAIDPGIHQRCTGTDNALILENARLLAKADKPMWVRLVLVPGWKDDREDIRARLRFVKSLGKAVRRVDVLKYHSLGAGKYRQMGIPYAIRHGTACSGELIRFVEETAREEGVDIKVEN